MKKNDFHYSEISRAINACKPQQGIQHKVAIGVMALGLALSVNAVSAAGIWVNTLDPDVNPSDGKCSLIEAIDNANAEAKVHPNCQKGNGADTIHLWRNNTYSLGKVHNSTSTGSNGLPVITSKVSINGKGASIIRDLNGIKSLFPPVYTGAIPGFRLFEVADGGELTLNDLTVSGGGNHLVFYRDYGPWSYDESGPGGAIHNSGLAILNNTTLSMNSGSGAIYNNDSGTMYLSNCTIASNNSGGNFLAPIIGNNGDLEIIDSSIYNNMSIVYGPFGSMISNSATMKITNSTVSGDRHGSSIDNQGQLYFERSTLFARGAIYSDYYGYETPMHGIVNSPNATLAFTNSMVIGARYYAAIQGDNQQLVLLNEGTVISKNNIFGDSSMAFTSADLTVEPSFAKGFTPDATDIIATKDGNQPTALKEIVATIERNGTDVPHIDNNGGPTKTIALVPGSIAIDAASNTNCPATDQRGIARPQGGACDIGAFEFEQTVSVGSGFMGDYVWEDLNKDGIQDSNEHGMSDVTVELQTCAGTVVDTVTTDSTGNFRFTQIPVGDYQMQYILPASHDFSPVNQGGNYRYDSNANQTTGLTPCLSMSDGQSRLAVDAGMVPKGSAFGTGIMGDYVWNDLNADGIQDSNEPGLSSVNIDLLSCSGDLMDTTYSDANGNFRFTGIAPGEYQMRYNLLSNYRYSPEKQGSNYRYDSNVNTSTGLTPCLSIADGQQRLAVDGGMVMEAPVGEPELAVTINDISSSKPGPVVTTGETLSWRYTVSNPTATELTNVVVRGRQKLPTLGSWETLCTIGTIAPTEEGSCATTSTAETGTYKMLVTINGVDAQGNAIQLSEQAFYQGR